DPRRGLAQDEVPGLVTEELVHFVEAVEVDVQQGDARRRAGGEKLLHPDAEQLPVRQPGKGIERAVQAGRLHDRLLKFTTYGNQRCRGLVLLSTRRGPCR